MRSQKVLVTVEIWALPIMFGASIRSILVFICLETLPKAPITWVTVSVLTLCSVLIAPVNSIHLLTFSFSLITILWSWGIGIVISCYFLSHFIITTISGLSCFIFVVVLISLSLGHILIAVWFIVCNGICSWQSVSSDFYVILSAQLPVWLKVTSFNISSSDISQVFQITQQSISPTKRTIFDW